MSAAPPVSCVLVAGSRTFADYPLLCATLDRVLAGRGPVAIVSGGAGGADRLGERYAAARGLAVDRFVPDWDTHGRAAGPIRNREMVAGCALAAFFWDGQSPGTAGAIARAREAGGPVEVVRYADSAPSPSGPHPAFAPAAAAPPAPPVGETIPPPPPRKLPDRVRDALRVRHYAIRTEEAYTDWVRRFVLLHGKRHPDDMGGTRSPPSSPTWPSRGASAPAPRTRRSARCCSRTGTSSGPSRGRSPGSSGPPAGGASRCT